MPKLIVHLNGPFRTTDSDGRAHFGLSRRAQGMLAYLACQPGFRAERALLADLLWSDCSEKQARASLRQELSMLRRLLPEGLLSADRQAVWLDSGLLACERGDGDFLLGFDLPSEGFEDWLRTERARTHVPSHARALQVGSTFSRT